MLQLNIFSRVYYVWIIIMSSFLKQIPIPMTEDLDPVLMLTDGAMVAQWNNEGLPGDKMSTQNAAILTNCELYILHHITMVTSLRHYQCNFRFA